ncbi:hypothetical protein SALBM311S_09399 [Streptomyces alboniger]
MNGTAGRAAETDDRVLCRRCIRRWPTSLTMLAGITAPSRRAALPSGRLILPRPGQYGQRRLSTSPDTAPTAAVPASANMHAKSASAEVYAPKAASDSSRFKNSVPKTATPVS